MKKVLFALVLLGVFSACSEKDYYEENKLEVNRSIEDLSLMKTYPLEFKPGHITVVKMGDEVIYEGNLGLVELEIPKYTSATTRSEDISVAYIPNETDIVYSKVAQSITLMFEDDPGGDSDYNDLILGVHLEVEVAELEDEEYTHQITVSSSGCASSAWGSALGSFYKLSFGFEIRDSKTGELLEDVMLTKNVREHYFKNTEGFINTEKGSDFISPKDFFREFSTLDEGDLAFKKNLKNPICFVWYIIANNKRLYTVDAARFLGANAGIVVDDIVRAEKMPYGLILPFFSGSFLQYPWPFEKIEIWEAYPSFKEWLKGDEVNPLSKANTSLLYYSETDHSKYPEYLRP